MKKIAIITNTATSLLNFRKELIKHLVIKGYTVYGFAIDFSQKTKMELSSLGAIPVDYDLSRGGLNPFSDISNTLKLSRIIRDLAPDIVFSTFSKPSIFGTLAARRVKVKRIVAMLEGLGYFFTDQPDGTPLKTRMVKQIQIFLYKFALPKADLVLFLNQDDLKDLLLANHIKVKSSKVLGGIGLSPEEFRFSEPPLQPLSFIFVGRLLKEKGIFEFLNAAEIVKLKYPNVIFYVLGGIDTENPGSLSKELLEVFVKKGIVQYPGEVRAVRDWLQKSSVFVLPSFYREGVPRSTQEAMMVGRPVITTDVPGCRDTVVDGYNGFLIQKWSHEELAEKMIYFIEHPQQIVEMGHNSRLFAEKNFDAAKVNDRLLVMLEGN